MFSKLFLLCLLAVARAAPQDVVAPVEVAAPVVEAVAPAVVETVAPAVIETAVPAVVQTVVPAVVAQPVQVIPTCRTEVEPLETQACTPRAEQICQAVNVVNQRIAYEKRCKDVVSRVCPEGAPVGGTVLVKREADPALLYSTYGLAAPISHGVTFATVRQACHEVTTQHCVDSPVVVDEPATVNNCNVVTKVDCAPVVHEIPKTVCDQVETVVHTEAHVAPATNPLAYHHGLYLGR